jgi:hypothetical protein
MLAWNYAARVLLFPDRATLAFLPGFVATDPVSVGAAATALLPRLSTEVVRISRWPAPKNTSPSWVLVPFAADEGEAQESEGLRTTDAAFLAVGCRMAAELSLDRLWMMRLSNG